MSQTGIQRLDEIQQEIASILETQLSELSASIKESEKLTRHIISNEMELQRHQKRQVEFKQEFELLTTQLQHSRKNLTEIQQQKEMLIQEHQQLEAELTEETREVERYRQTAEELRKELEEQEGNSKALRNENAKLKLQVKALKDQIEGMKRLRDDHLLSIMQNTQELQKVSTGKE